MIAIDTNIVVRLLTKDDEAQYQASYKLFKESEIFIPETVIQATEWVLRRAYSFKQSDISAALRKSFGLKNVQLRNAPALAKVLDWYDAGLDFSDALHLSTSQHCATLKTFDERFIKRAKQLSDCAVEKP